VVNGGGRGVEGKIGYENYIKKRQSPIELRGGKEKSENEAGNQ